MLPGIQGVPKHPAARPRITMATVELLPTTDDLVLARIESLPFGENTYVLGRQSTAECLVVDPGFEPEAVIDFICGRGLVPTAILLTHGHSDHIAGNGALRDRWPGLPILIGREDAEKLLDPVKNLSAAFGVPVTSPPADRTLVDGERVATAGFSLSVTAIPGHSRGHVVFRIEAMRPPLVFAGDVLFHEGIGRTDFADGDFGALDAGIRRGLYTLSDDTVVLPGHGGPTTIGHERRHNPFVTDAAARGGRA